VSSRSAFPITVPLGRTARRLEWVHLPPAIRRAVERQLGAAVVEAESRDSGYTPGFASVLTCADGTRHFVKAASTKAQRMSAAMYREEARKLRVVPPGIGVPRLQWVHDADDWVVLGIEYVEGELPQRPWLPEQLAAASAMLVELADALTPAPGIGIGTLTEDVAEWPALWEHLPHISHAEEASALAARQAEVTGGDTLVHADVRDDNLIVRPDGSVALCDWNWPRVGAAWFDSLVLLIGPRGDGLDVEAHLADHPLLGKVDPEAIDIVLALLTGYFLKHAADPAPPAVPWVREIQLWQGEVAWHWLAERRGWL